MKKSRAKLNALLAEYKVSHRNPRNILIHKVCVPLIMISIIGLLWCIPRPQAMHNSPYFNWAAIAIMLSMIFYTSLGSYVLLWMLVIFGAMFALVAYLENFIPLLPTMLAIFILSWVGQFIGHKIEGKKPSFMQDLQFLLVGPIWVFWPFIKIKR